MQEHAGARFPPFVRALSVPMPLLLSATRAQAVSGQELGEREGAMATRWDQVVLPVGREQDRINACVVGARGEIEYRPIGIVAVHCEPCAIEVSNRRLEDDKVHSSSGFGAEVISGRV